MQNTNIQILTVIYLFVGCTDLTVECPECDTDTETVIDSETAAQLTTDNKKKEQLQDDSETEQLKDDSETEQLKDDSETEQLQDDSETEQLQDDSESELNPIQQILDDCNDMQDFFTYCYNNSPGFSGPTYTQMQSICGANTVYDWFARSHSCWEMPLTVSQCDGADLDMTNDCVHFMACMQNCGL
jgi:hypothetical protein